MLTEFSEEVGHVTQDRLDEDARLFGERLAEAIFCGDGHGPCNRRKILRRGTRRTFVSCSSLRPPKSEPPGSKTHSLWQHVPDRHADRNAVRGGGPFR